MTKPYHLAKTDKPGVYAVISSTQVEPIGMVRKGNDSRLNSRCFRVPTSKVIWCPVDKDDNPITCSFDYRAEAAQAVYDHWLTYKSGLTTGRGSVGTSTGRLDSSKPNFVQVPSRNDEPRPLLVLNPDGTDTVKCPECGSVEVGDDKDWKPGAKCPECYLDSALKRL